MFEASCFAQASTLLHPGDLLVLYSDGITEAEDRAGVPFEESGLELAIERHSSATAADLGSRILSAVEAHAGEPRFTDDLTLLILRRLENAGRTTAQPAA